MGYPTTDYCAAVKRHREAPSVLIQDDVQDKLLSEQKQNIEKCAEKAAICVKRENKYIHTRALSHTHVLKVHVTQHCPPLEWETGVNLETVLSI